MLLWFYDFMVLWFDGFMVHGFIVFWFCGFIVVWFFCVVVLWLYGFLVLHFYQTSVSCFQEDIDPICKIFDILIDGSSVFFPAPVFSQIVNVLEFRNF